MEKLRNQMLRNEEMQNYECKFNLKTIVSSLFLETFMLSLRWPSNKAGTFHSYVNAEETFSTAYRLC